MRLRVPAKVLLHVWSYDFYDMTLSTGKYDYHMINFLIKNTVFNEETRNSQLHMHVPRGEQTW